jgi:hypothetical protein
VIGVDRTGDAEGLLAAGADVVVSDLADVLVDPPFSPSALVCAGDIDPRLPPQLATLRYSLLVGGC